MAAVKTGLVQDNVKQEYTLKYPRENEVPFDSERKRMITIHDVKEPNLKDLSPFRDKKKRNWDVIAVKGAPDIVLDLCTHYQTKNDVSKPLTSSKRREILGANNAMTEHALRVLGFAYRVERDVPDDLNSVAAENLEKDLVFVGLVGMIDPPRAEIKPALAKARLAGIRTVMITGDYPNTRAQLRRRLVYYTAEAKC